MRTQQHARFLLFVALVVVSSFAVSCGGDPEPDPTATGSPVLPVSFPYIFSGNFTIAGEPGPQGVPLFARLGNCATCRGPFNNSIREGEYTNVSISPQKVEDIGKEITFHLGHPDGPTVQAEETYVFTVPSQPQLLELDLTFPRMP